MTFVKIKQILRELVLIIYLVSLFCLASPAQSPPNIIFILADDLGYGDVGCFGQTKIKTPNIDKLAKEGIRFTHHYSGSPVCAPSRCVLLTGKHTGHSFIRDNREVKPEGQFPIPENTVTLPKILKKGGYTTAVVGKWGLGGPGSSGDPLKQGFDYFFGYNCQRHAHNYYPTYLRENTNKVMLDNPEFSPYQKLPPDADPNNPQSYKQYIGKIYSADLIAEKAREFVLKNKERPFFLYWATTVPHLALQVPEDSLSEYSSKWDDPPYTGTNGYLPHFTPRSAYAAMITRMDKEIGKMLEILKENKLEDNTIIIFTSDNGPLWDRYGGTDSEFFNSAGGLRGFKGTVYEGGLRVPMIVRWKNHIKPGAISTRTTGFEDWLPTILELVGLTNHCPRDIDGISFAPTLLGKTQPERSFLYREFPGRGGQQAVWVGEWKLVKTGLMKLNSNPKVELFNINTDRSETVNLAEKFPEIVKKLERIAEEQHTASVEFPMPLLDKLIKR